jgi:Holliday junction resolvasome RuvABC ATP-dependent DNA helicase subunit
VGYDDIKDLVRRALDSNENYNLLLCGPPASAKTLFLLGILQCRKGVYFDGSNTTNRILDVIEEDRPKVICIDELEKMARNFQNQLLNFLGNGRVKVEQQRRSYDFEIKSAKVFATCNEINRLSKPLQSRFRHLSPYTKQQFLNIVVKVCPKLKEEISRIIGEEVWNQGSKDIRDVISLGKLIRKGDGYEEIIGLVKTLTKYADVNVC